MDVPEPRYDFFLSYAGSDDALENELVQRLYDDLIHAILEADGDTSSQRAGFLDRRMSAGDSWSEQLIDALSTCQTLLVLISPQFFASDWCRREWTVFRERMNAYRELTGVDAPALMPLIWTPDPSLSTVLPHPGSATARDAYRHLGLRELVRRRSYRRQYREFVADLAGRILEVSARHPIPAADKLPDFGQFRRAFSTDAGAGLITPSPRHHGPRRRRDTRFDRPIFLSYSRADRAYVEELAAHLTAQGLTVWYDRELIAGDRFDQTIQRQIEDCSAFVVVLSPDAVDSDWVALELNYACALRKPVFPLMRTRTDLPFMLNNVHFENVTDGQMPSASFVDALRNPTNGSRPWPRAI